MKTKKITFKIRGFPLNEIRLIDHKKTQKQAMAFLNGLIQMAAIPLEADFYKRVTFEKNGQYFEIMAETTRQRRTAQCLFDLSYIDFLPSSMGAESVEFMKLFSQKKAEKRLKYRLKRKIKPQKRPQRPKIRHIKNEDSFFDSFLL